MRFLLLCCLAPLLLAQDPALPLLHPLFTDHGVVQQGRPIPVWGWTTPGTAVSLRVVATGGTTSQTGTAGSDGRWTITAGPFQVGDGPLSLVVAAGTATAAASDLLVGEVWLCSGQSNMDWRVDASDDAATAIPAADHPRIRLFNQPAWWSFTPKPVPNATWQVCTPATVAGFSGVGYHFGSRLHQVLDGTPIGLVKAAFGGAFAQDFLDEAALRTFGDFADAIAERERARPLVEAGTYDLAKENEAYWRRLDGGQDQQVPAFDDATWESHPVPGQWEINGWPDFDGVAWYRLAVELTAAQASGGATVTFCPIDDQDVTWINGIQVGSTIGWDQPRTYAVPPGTLTSGRNLIAVRVLDGGGGGGFHGDPAAMGLRCGDGSRIPLEGTWHAQRGRSFDRLPARPKDYGWPMGATTIQYNQLIAPIVGFPLAGVAWYQGESNSGAPAQYARLLPTLIARWRELWHQDDLPFLIVQLAGIGGTQSAPAPAGVNTWAETMLVQAQVAATVPRVGLATASDLCKPDDPGDVHPTNKAEVGRRLVYPALRLAYPRAEHPADGVGGSPTVAQVERQGSAVRVRFNDVGNGLRIPNPPLRRFALAGADGIPVWADARLDGRDAVIVSAPSISHPVTVQFNVDNNPPKVIENSEGLPMLPFRIAVP